MSPRAHTHLKDTSFPYQCRLLIYLKVWLTMIQKASDFGSCNSLNRSKSGYPSMPQVRIQSHKYKVMTVWLASNNSSVFRFASEDQNQSWSHSLPDPQTPHSWWWVSLLSRNSHMVVLLLPQLSLLVCPSLLFLWMLHWRCEFRVWEISVLARRAPFIVESREKAAPR